MVGQERQMPIYLQGQIKELKAKKRSNYETNYQNKTSKKLNGGWFVTALKHTLTQNSFGSEIVCTKFHELK